MTRAAAFCLAPVFLASVLATSPRAQSAAWGLEIEPTNSPAGPQSGQPHLSVSSRGVILSWVERVDTVATLKFAELSSSGWTPPRTVASGRDWFVNWADVPSVARLAGWRPRGALAAEERRRHLCLRRPAVVLERRRADLVPVIHSPPRRHADRARLRLAVQTPRRRPRPRVARRPRDEGDRLTAATGMPATCRCGSLRSAPTGSPRPRPRVDLRVCECCPTAVAVTGRRSDRRLPGSQRDRSAGHLRHPSRERQVVCAGRGPCRRLDRAGVPGQRPGAQRARPRRRDRVVHRKGDQPRAFVAFSSDAGRTFGSPIRLDDQATLGRVEVELLPDGSAAASYVEFAAQKASFRVRRIERSGRKSAPVTVTGIAGNRASGLPRMAIHGRELIFAWVDREGGSQVRTARAVLK